MVDKSIRTVSAATLEGIVEAMGYKRMGRSVRCYLQEDRNGRSALFHLLIGSVARGILDASPCDTLLVPEPRAGRDA